jgi:hypothetical protein
MESRLKETCLNCGLTLGSHSAGGYYSHFYKAWIHSNQCPGHEGRMDWDAGPGTAFIPSGNYKDIPYNTPARGIIERIEDVKSNT